jgi:hypothetical protein
VALINGFARSVSPIDELISRKLERANGNGRQSATHHQGGRLLDGDRSYALACIVRSFVGNTGGLNDTAGFGVGFAPNDNDGSYRILTLDVKDGTVRGTSGKAVKVVEFMEK